MEDHVGKRTLLGVLTPSSNTVLEPLTSAIVADLPDVSAHFGRFRVREISLSDEALRQFDLQPILEAAGLLADARVGSIIWSGTSSGWLGFEADEALCREITAATDVPASTSVLALNEAMAKAGAKRMALVTPYLDAIQEKILQNYVAAGYECVAERHLQDRGNFSFSEYSEAKIAQLIREVAEAKPDVIAVFCTNMRGAGLVEVLELETGIPIFDTVATAVWKGMKLAGDDPGRVHHWGRLFREVH